MALYRDELTYPSPYRRSLAIEDINGLHIGNAMYYNIDTVRREAEIGITIGEREYWSRGYGTDAVKTLVSGAVLAKAVLTWQDPPPAGGGGG